MFLILEIWKIDRLKTKLNKISMDAVLVSTRTSNLFNTTLDLYVESKNVKKFVTIYKKEVDKLGCGCDDLVDKYRHFSAR